MVFLSAWLRRSNVMTGAEWIQTRFGKGRGAQLAHIIVVVYAFVSIIGFFSTDSRALARFAANFLPWSLTPNQYALVLIALTTIYVVKGGHVQRSGHRGPAVLYSLDCLLRGGHHRHGQRSLPRYCTSSFPPAGTTCSSAGI